MYPLNLNTNNVELMQEHFHFVLLLQGHHPDGGAHAKFTNYRFDTKEFLRLVAKAEKHILNHKAYKKFVNENVFHDEL